MKETITTERRIELNEVTPEHLVRIIQRDIKERCPESYSGTFYALQTREETDVEALLRLNRELNKSQKRIFELEAQLTLAKKGLNKFGEKNDF